jgi:hypothetical protein
VGRRGAPASTCGVAPLSMPPPVDRRRLRRFLDELGRRVRFPVRLYLHGGAISLWRGSRNFTVDIGYDADVRSVASAAWERALRGIARELDVNVEPAGPADFIPLPDGWQGRCSFVGQYGSLSVSTFDPYSTALAKIARGTRTAMDDVRQWLAAGDLERERLRAMADAIVPRWNERVARQSAATFPAKVDAALML